MTIAAAKERPGFAGYSFGLADDEVTAARQELDDLPATDAAGKASFPVTLDKLPATTRPLEATITVSMAESGGRAVERKLTLPIAPDAAMIGVKPVFSGRSLADGANADFDVVMVAPDGKTAGAKRPALRAAAGRDLVSVVPAERQLGIRADQAHRARRRRHGRRRRRQAGAHLAAGEMGPLSPRSVDRRRRTAPITSLSFDAGFYAEASADTPDLLEVALDKTEYKSGDAMTVVGDRAHRRPPHAQRVHRPAGRHARRRTCKAGSVRVPLTVGKDWGTGAYLVATLRRPLDAPAQRMPGRAIGVQWFSIDRAARTLALDMKLPATHAAEFRAQRADQARRAYRRRGGARRRRRRRCRHSQSHQLQAAGARRLLSRPAPAHRRDPRPLRAIDRRHAGRARRRSAPAATAAPN